MFYLLFSLLFQLCSRNLSRDDFVLKKTKKTNPLQRRSWSPSAAWGEGQLPLNNSSQRPICAAVWKIPFHTAAAASDFHLVFLSIFFFMLLLYVFPPGMNVCFILWFDITERSAKRERKKKKVKPCVVAAGVSQQPVPQRNVATRFLNVDYRKSFSSFHVVNYCPLSHARLVW